MSMMIEDDEISKPQSGIVVISDDEMTIFTVMQDQFAQQTQFLQIPQKGLTSPATCGIAIIADYKNKFFQQTESEVAGQQHLFLTGHKDGKVLLWRYDSFIAVLIDYMDQITCMSKCFEGLVICTWSGKVNIWDAHLTRCTNSIELINLPFKLLSFNISSVDYN